MPMKANASIYLKQAAIIEIIEDAIIKCGTISTDIEIINEDIQTWR